MAISAILLTVLCALGHISASEAACSREKLQATSDAFLAKSGAAGLKVSSSAKIAVNNKFVQSIQDTIWAKHSGQAKPFKLTVLDEATCNMATFAVLRSASGNGTITSIRAKIAEDGELREVEIIDTTGGKSMMGGKSGGKSYIPENVPALWSAPLHTGTGAAPSREKLVQILDSYPAGIQAGDAKNVQTSKSCQRIENGMMQIPCAVGYQALKFPVTNRGFYVDTKTGVSLAKFFFDQEKKGGMLGKMGNLWIHEYFKISNEKIQEIQAAFITLPGGQGAFKDIMTSN